MEPIEQMEQNKNSRLRLKLNLLWLAILLLGSFWLTVRGTSDLVSMTVVPQVPREGETILVIYKLNNPSSQPMVTGYQFYANGELLDDGTTAIAPESSKTYEYAYANTLKLGEQINFLVRTQSEQGDYEKFVSTPAYPPQIWSSFTSFAAFSTSMFSSTSTAMINYSIFYHDSSPQSNGWNVGLIATMVLTLLLIFLELSQPAVQGKPLAALGRLRIRFSTVTWILFIIFLGIVYTKIVLIITG